ncbi:MAG: hypothetical protein KAG97_06065, partial [Victivallales bacterium]|nr:hypothetical protein [Victivallales bacterium]
MSYFSKMSEIDIGSIGINKKASANGFENAPEGILTYLAAYGVVVVASAACVVAQLDTPDARLANLAGFWIPLVYFAAAMDFACWYLFQSGILRRILPLPFDIGEIHNRFRYSDIFSGMFFILRCVLALCLGVASGIVVKSVWSGLCVGLYAFALLEILDKFAFAAAVKTHRVFMGFRRVPMVVASLFFFVSALLLALDDRSAKLAVDSISAIFAFNLFPVDAHPLAFLSTACALFIWDAYLYQWEFEFWRRNV